ncbi:MAG: autotransporter domain-containing protein [Hyphomicrobiales bacterium]|nr:autotransporter domain-containing protein [Hyphomicrobiales bacterium]
MDSSSAVNSPGGMYAATAVWLSTNNGLIQTATPSGSGINGSITATSGYGTTALEAISTGAGGGISILTGSGATIAGSGFGIYAYTDGSNAINLTVNGATSGSYGSGVGATAASGAINMILNGAISNAAGGYGAVSAVTSGGAIVLSGKSAITSTNGFGINAADYGAGNISMNMQGAISGNVGVSANGSGGDVTLAFAAPIKSVAGGVVASTTGVGAMTVTTAGAVTATAGAGVSATNVDGVNTVSVGVVTASADGVDASSTGKGSTTVGVHGNVASSGGVGVNAAGNSSAVEVDIDSGVFVSGKTAGVVVATQTGTATVVNKGTISGGATGDGVDVVAKGGAAVLVNSGSILSTAGAAINVASGVVAVQNSGVLNGQVGLTRGSVVTLNNSGAWTNAAGSSVTNLANTGTITFGPAGGPVGLITAPGNASFGPGSVLNMRIASTTSGGVTTVSTDQIVVGGKTTISGGIITLSGSAANLFKGAKLTLLTSGLGVSGNFSGVSSSLGAYTGILTSDANNIYLDVLSRDFTPYALNRNQTSVANAIWLGSGSLLSAAGSQILKALNNLSSSDVPGALTQLSGDGVVTGAEHAAMQAGHLFAATMEDQEDIWNSNIRGPGNSITLTEPFAYAPARSADSKWPVSRQQYAPPPPTRPLFAQRTWRVWASGFGGETKIHGNSADGSSNQRAGGVGGSMGVDYQFGERMLLGVAAGYSSSSFGVNDTNVSGSVNGLHVGVYSGFHVGAFYANANVSYGNYSNSTKRSVSALGGLSAETDKADYKSEELRTRLEVGRKLSMEALSITPFAAIEVAHIHAHGFSEYGISAAGGPGVYTMAFNGQGARSIPTFIGLKVESRFEAGSVALTPWVSIAWRHEWSPTSQQTGALVALPTANFVVYGAKPAADALQLKAGLQLQIAQNATIYAGFEGDILSKTPVYGGRGGLRIGW